MPAITVVPYKFPLACTSPPAGPAPSAQYGCEQNPYNSGELAARSDFEDSAPVVGSAKLGCSVEVPSGLHQPGDGLLTVRAARFASKNCKAW